MLIQVYYKELGGHTHLRLFFRKALIGTLIFKNEEFIKFMREKVSFDFIKELPH